MGIAPDTTGKTTITAGATSASVDITAAAVGAWCYLWADISTGSITQTGVPSNASWTTLQSVQTAAGTSGATYAMYRRQKQSGDTTFSFTWTTFGKGTFSWSSYTGLNNAGPDEQSTITLNDTTSRAAVPTPTATPSAAGEWALAFFGQRSTVSTNKPTAWTPDAALTERIEADNSAAASAPWIGTDIEDSNAAVTVAAHSYTATSNQTESHDGSGILFLVPAAAATAVTAQAIVVAPRPRPRPRAVVVLPLLVPAAVQVLPVWPPVIPRARPRSRGFTWFTVGGTAPPPPPPPPPVSIPPAIPTSGGDRGVTIRVFREIRPGDVPATGAQLPKLTGRAFLMPVPADTDHATHAWEVEQPPEPPVPGILDALAEVRDQATETAGRVVELGRIFADPPYQRHRKTCGAIRKIGGVMLTCKRKPGHAGTHSDRGLDWR